jgi:hypothetical protein
MTTAKERAFNRAVRAYMTEHGVSLTTARRALSAAPSADLSPVHGRAVTAAKAIGVPATVDAVAQAMFTLAGQRVPVSAPGRQLTGVLLNAVGKVHDEPATPNDLYHHATRTGEKAVIPPIPATVITAAAELDTVLNALTASDLKTAAADLGISRADIGTASLLLHHGLGAELGNPVGPGSRRRPTEEQAQTIAESALREDPVTDPRALAVLRWTIRAELSLVGDVILRLSAWPAAEMFWSAPDADAVAATRDSQGRLVAIAYRSVDGAPEPLQARIYRDPGKSRFDIDVDKAPFFGPAETSAVPDSSFYEWQIGWNIDGEFHDIARSTERTRRMAEHAAGSYMHTVLEHPADLESRLGQRLFVPRTGILQPGEERQEVTLSTVINGAAHYLRREKDDTTLWDGLPHHDPEQGLNCVGLLLDEVTLPLPDSGSPANHARPDDPEFLAFFHANAIAVTPAALAYLTAFLGTPGEPATIAARHAIGLNRVLAAGDAAAALEELGTLPAGTAAERLADVDVLLAWQDIYYAG